MSLQSLGAAYGSDSGSESDDGEAGTSVANQRNSSDDDTSAKLPTKNQSDAGGQRSFFKTASDDSSDDDDVEQHNYGRSNSKTQGVAEKPLPRLPSAFEALNKATRSSVFQTTQGAEEEASTALLEHHVKLTAAVVNESRKERAPVCRAFKKGRCNKGDRCRYSHVVAGGIRANEAAKKANTDPTDAKFVSKPVAYDGWGEKEEKAKKRRKPGVTNTLAPAKKAMQMFQKQKAEEEPWSAQRK